jgi:uncharacterized membrane protein
MATTALPLPTSASAVPERAVSAAPPRRLDSIDLLRGIVMVIMVLDHTRDFALAATLHFQPTDLTQTTPAIFFTRWITHFCAPIFVLLAGTGAYLQRTRGRSRAQLSWFLLTRGLWLIVLEFTLVHVGFTFTWDPHFLGAAQVIWVTGASILAGLIYPPVRVVGAIGVLMIVLHNTLDTIPTYQWTGPGSPSPTPLAALWTVLHGGWNVLPLGHPFPVVLVVYAVIPWVGVMAAGYGLGALYDRDPDSRQRILTRLGTAITVGFLAIRAINIYGDPAPWSAQHSTVYTVLSFLNTTKYPPSLEYLMMTLGPALLALAGFERLLRSPRAAQLVKPLIVFGRVPLFFYLLQWYFAHGLSLALGAVLAKPTGYLFWHFPPTAPPPDAGFSLGVTYLIWLTSILLLYPLCAWYAGVKRRHRDWRVLSYL